MAEFDRHVIEAAATYMADEDAGGVGFLYSTAGGARRHYPIENCQRKGAG